MANRPLEIEYFLETGDMANFQKNWRQLPALCILAPILILSLPSCQLTNDSSCRFLDTSHRAVQFVGLSEAGPVYRKNYDKNDCWLATCRIVERTKYINPSPSLSGCVQYSVDVIGSDRENVIRTGERMILAGSPADNLFDGFSKGKKLIIYFSKKDDSFLDCVVAP